MDSRLRGNDEGLGIATEGARLEKQSFVYILASAKHGALYIGVTSDLLKRLYEHRNNIIKGHTSRHAIYHLVYFESFDDINAAILREKRLKKWNRDWKLNLIEGANPEWVDLALSFGFEPVMEVK